jgi:hypothetical protein
MSEFSSHIEELASNAKEYINTKVEIAKLSAAEKVSGVTSAILSRIAVLVIFLFFVLFLCIAAALLLGEWLGKAYWGFLVIAGICLLKAIVFWLARERLIRIPIMNAIIQQLFKDSEHHEKDQEH